MKKLIFILSLFFVFSCEDKENSDHSFPPINIIDLSSEDDFWDLMVLGEEDYFCIHEENSLPQTVYYSSGNGQDCSILFNEQGLPLGLISDNYIVVFDNFHETKFDVAVIFPDGEIEIYREVETSDLNWNDLSSDFKSTQKWSDVVKWTGRILDALPCATSLGSLLFTAGGSIPLTVLTCGNYFVKLAAEINEEKGTHNGFTEFVDKYEDEYEKVSTIISCATGDFEECLDGALSIATDELIEHLEEIEEREDDVRIAEGALETGYGDAKITLTWDNTSDIDLHILDPNGEEIWWKDKYSASGGILDVDDIDGYGSRKYFLAKRRSSDRHI